LLKESVVLPPELLTQIESFIETHKQLGFVTREEFIRDAARWRLRYLTGTYEYIEVNRDRYEKGDAAVKEMNLPCPNTDSLSPSISRRDFLKQPISLPSVLSLFIANEEMMLWTGHGAPFFMAGNLNIPRLR
jgi:hypothetical protein